MLLEGKSAVVTGSGRGLGRAFAIGLAEAGAKVVVNSRTEAEAAETVEEITKRGGTATACIESVATMEGSRRIIQKPYGEELPRIC